MCDETAKVTPQFHEAAASNREAGTQIFVKEKKTFRCITYVLWMYAFDYEHIFKKQL